MKWNWQRKDWHDFTYNTKQIEALEKEFLKQSGTFVGAFSYLT